MRLLVVEDDPDLNRQLTTALSDAGYVVDRAFDGEEGHFLGDSEPYDAVVLDIGLPKMDGISVLEAWRRNGRAMPVLILTARGLAADRIEGLGLGADDYLAKPFEPEELVLRINAILRRAGPAPVAPAKLTLGDCTFDAERGELTCNGQPVRLTEAEAALLRALAKRPHEPVDRWDLVSADGDGVPGLARMDAEPIPVEEAGAAVLALLEPTAAADL